MIPPSSTTFWNRISSKGLLLLLIWLYTYKPPCGAALKTEKFGTLSFKHAQATKSQGFGIKSANSICCKKPRVEALQAIRLCLGIFEFCQTMPDNFIALG